MGGPLVAGPARPFAARSDRKTGGAQSTGATNGTFVDVSFQTNDFLENPTPGFITKPNDTDFNLVFPGIYRVFYKLHFDAAGNDVGCEGRASLAGTPIPGSEVYHAPRANINESKIASTTFLVRTTAANQVLRIQAAPREAAAVDVLNNSTCIVELVRLT